MTEKRLKQMREHHAANKEKANAVARKRYYDNREEVLLQRKNSVRVKENIVTSSARGQRLNNGWAKAKSRRKPWEINDDEIVVNSTITIREKAEILGRSYKAITARMGRLKKLNSNDIIAT